MPKPDPDIIWPKLEKDGVEEVRKKLMRGDYAKFKIPVVEEWLRQKEQKKETLEPKPPEIAQKIKWLFLYGRQHWKIVLICALVLLIPFITKLIVDLNKSNSEKQSTHTKQEIKSSPESNIYQAGRDIIVSDTNRNKTSAKDIIESIIIESRLTSVLKENTKYPPAVSPFIPTSGAPAVFEGPAGTVKFIFQSPIYFKRLDSDEIIIINKFNMPSGSDLHGRSVSVLHNYESLIVPIVTSMFGNSFSTLRLLEITIYLNGNAKWYKSWVYNVDFPRGNSFNIPLSDILVE